MLRVRTFASLVVLLCAIALIPSGCTSDDDPAAQQERVDTLIKELGNEDEGLRFDAAWELRGLGEVAVDAVPALIQSLVDESERVRWAAASALGAIGPTASDASAGLVGALSDDTESVRATARMALRGIGEAAVPALIDGLSAGAVDVQAQAAEVLTVIGTVAALAAVKAWKEAQQQPQDGAA